MKINLFFIIIFLMIAPAFIRANEINGTALQLVEIKKIGGTTEIYVKNDQNQPMLLYKANFIYSGKEKINAKQKGAVLWVDFFCEKKKTCTRLFNRRSGKLSDFYPYLIDYDVEKDIVAIYDQDKNQLTLKTAFAPCMKPAFYRLAIAPGSSFGVDTGFKPNGYLETTWLRSYAYYKFLKIDYIDPVAHESVKLVIPIYYTFFPLCKTGKPYHVINP